MKLFEIFGEIKIDGDGALKTLSNTDEKGSKVAKSFGKSAKAIGKAGKIAAIGVGAIATGMGAIVTKATNAAAEIDKFSQVTGMSTKSYQEWDFVMKKYGYTMEQASGDLAALGEKAMEASTGVGEGAEMFEKLGVQVTDASGNLRSQERIFNDTITALQGMENATERNAIASALLSTTGEELVPILNMTKQELDGVKNSAHEMGAVMSQESIDSGVMLKQTMSDLTSSIGGVFNEIGVMLMPTMQKMADWIISNMPKIKKFFVDAFDLIAKSVDYLYNIFEEYLMPVLMDIYDWARQNAASIKAIMEFAFKAVIVVVKAAFDAFKFIFDILVAIYEWAEPTFPMFRDTIVGAFDIIVGAVKLGIDIFKTMKSAAEDAIDSIIAALEYIERFNDESDVGKGGSNMGTVFKNVYHSSPLKDFFSGMGDLLFGGFRAKGGPVSDTKAYMVGEKGPEMFVPDTSGTIIPNNMGSTVNYNLNQGAIQVNIPVSEIEDIKNISDLFKRIPQLRRGV